MSSETRPASGQTKVQKFLVWLGLAAISAGVVAHCYPLYFSPLTRSGRAIYTYSLDSFVLLSQVETAFNAPRFHLEFTDYGQLYFNLAILGTWFSSLFTHPTQGVILFILQIASLVGGLLTLWATFLFSRRFFSDLIALYCAAALALTPPFLAWCLEPHPDTWQMFFVSLSIFLCVLSYPPPNSPGYGSSLNMRTLLGAAAAAGAAFSTKYLGVLLIPFLFATALAAPLPRLSQAEAERTWRQLGLAAIVLVVPALAAAKFMNAYWTLRIFRAWQVLPAPTQATFAFLFRVACLGLAAMSLLVAALSRSRNVTKYAGIAQRMLLLLAILAVFFLTFGLTSPWAAWRLAFVPSIYTMNAYVNFGHGVKASAVGFGWPITLAEQTLIGEGAAILALMGIVVTARQWKRVGFRLARAPLVLVAAWVIFYVTFLMLRVNLFKDYYMLPVVPATIVLTGAGLAKLREWLTSRLSADGAQKITAGIMIAVLAAQAWMIIPILKVQAFPRQMAPEHEAVGKWLLACVPRNARIMSAAYAYIPPDFENASLNTDQGGFTRLRDYHPTLVILNVQDIIFYAGSLANSVTNLEGNTNDKVLYFNAVAHSPGWVSGPKIGNYRVFMKPQLHDQIAQLQKSCAGPR